MTTFAGEIAEKLQGAHERRSKGEDTRMSRDNEPLSVGESVWDEDPFVHAMKLVERLDKVLNDIATSGHAPGDPQASAVSAERVVELERQLAAAREAQNSGANAYKELERERDELREKLARAESHGLGEGYEHEGTKVELLAARELLATAYVAREVPWSDVAAGMMTLSKSERPVPFLVSKVKDDVAWVLVGKHGDQVIEFQKTPTPGETVRVLVPYVTDEQAEGLVRRVLGGIEVGS